MKKVILSLAIGGVALGSSGCGPELIPAIVMLAGTTGAVAFTIQQIQQVQSADLDIQMKQLRLRGMQNGQPTAVDQPLSDAQIQGINDTGTVTVNGKVITVNR